MAIEILRLFAIPIFFLIVEIDPQVEGNMCRKVNVREGERKQADRRDVEWDCVCYYMYIKIDVFLSYQVVAQKINRNM